MPRRRATSKPSARRVRTGNKTTDAGIGFACLHLAARDTCADTQAWRTACANRTERVTRPCARDCRRCVTRDACTQGSPKAVTRDARERDLEEEKCGKLPHPVRHWQFFRGRLSILFTQLRVQLREPRRDAGKAGNSQASTAQPAQVRQLEPSCRRRRGGKAHGRYTGGCAELKISASARVLAEEPGDPSPRSSQEHFSRALVRSCDGKANTATSPCPPDVGAERHGRARDHRRVRTTGAVDASANVTTTARDGRLDNLHGARRF